MPCGRRLHLELLASPQGAAGATADVEWDEWTGQWREINQEGNTVPHVTESQARTRHETHTRDLVAQLACATAARRPAGWRACAVVLYEPDPRYGERIKACSAAARARGIRPAMPLAEAHALTQSGGEPHCERHDRQRDCEVLAKLAGACERFSPVVGLDQVDEPDCLLLDIGGVAGLFGGEAALARQVVEFFQQSGWQLRVALADTARAAWAFARLAAQEEFVPVAPSGGYRIVPAGDDRAWRELPVAALRLPERAAERLRRLGIVQLAQLADLPRASLGQRFGAQLTAHLDQLRGAAPEVLAAQKTPELPAAQRLLEHPTTCRAVLEHVLDELFQQVALQLQARGHGALRLDCRLIDEQQQPTLLHVSLVAPVAEAGHWRALARLQLERLLLPQPVEEVQVAAAVTAPCQRRQGELFTSPSHDQPVQLALLIECLSNRLGRDRVLRPQLQPEAQVELAYRVVPWTGGEPQDSPPSSAAAGWLGGRCLARCGSSIRRSRSRWSRSPATVRPRCSSTAGSVTASRAASGRSGSRPAGGAANHAPRLLSRGDRTRRTAVAVPPPAGSTMVLTRRICVNSDPSHTRRLGVAARQSHNCPRQKICGTMF